MGNPAPDVLETFRSFLGRVDKSADFDRDTSLYAEGLGLDSLEIAELAAVLEDEYDTDPFTADAMPATVGDIVDFYGSAVPKG